MMQPARPLPLQRRPLPRPRGRQRGAGAAEFVIVAPALLALTLAMLQTGLAYHARSIVNYASFEAARAGSVAHAGLASMRLAFARAMTSYYGGGRDLAEIADSFAAAQLDLATALRIEIVSPTRESFDDYYSPAAAQRLQTSARVLPSAQLGVLDCPAERANCNADPASNRSGQTLADANLLKLRVTWGLPPAKQVPLAGRFFTWALRTLDPDDEDAFRRSLVEAGRIPLVSQVTLRMQSDAIENAAILPRARTDGASPTPAATPLPGCAPTDPLCPPDPASTKTPPETPPSAGEDGTPADDGNGSDGETEPETDSSDPTEDVEDTDDAEEEPEC